MLFPKPVRRVFFLVIVLTLGYYGYAVVRPHLTQEAVAFKRYSNALRDGDLYKATEVIADDYAKLPFQHRTKRDEAIDGEIRFVYHRIRNLVNAEDGKSASITVRQIIRYDPPGVESFFGTETMVNVQQAKLFREQSSWRVVRYTDNFFPEGGVASGTERP